MPIIASRKYSGGPKPRASWLNSGASRVIRMTPTVPPTNEADRLHHQRRPGAPLPGQGIAVEGGGDGRRFARRVEQDRGDRAAVHGGVVDRRQHHHGGDRVHAEGERHEDRDPGRRPEARDDPDHHADQRADHEEHEVGGRQRDGHPEREIGEEIHRLRPTPSGDARTPSKRSGSPWQARGNPAGAMRSASDRTAGTARAADRR